MGRKWVGVQPRGPNHEDVRIARSFFETETEEGLRGLGQREGVGGADGFRIGAGIENFQREGGPSGEVVTGLSLIDDIPDPRGTLEGDAHRVRGGNHLRLRRERMGIGSKRVFGEVGEAVAIGIRVFRGESRGLLLLVEMRVPPRHPVGSAGSDHQGAGGGTLMVRVGDRGDYGVGTLGGRRDR